ncbi:ribulose-phosphate 3-epimerase [Herbivorax sp. ANBcel31]|uniref:ribulose-phosphate 3-epimerase n=1 Tax=Herbivorax sp. ANBcel31 TaxID=3069754 RepID=UPI0027B6CB9C|nr:ribulose-phosphate 3-epimerase [Herbivorax sp. ANBcel31]MDQ2087159.1 ribulose-phosphate 3-epimerase [Herbivorax sp. ANBcel31]
MIKIAPSLLSADFSKMGEEISEVESAGADLLHIDVMDGSFVPNITIGPPVIRSLKKISKLQFDVHLMIKNPENHIESFVKAGADSITVHVEENTHLHKIIQQIKSYGVKASVAINPSTSLSTIEWILDELDMILIMSVNPGFGGQEYIEFTTKKIENAKKMIDNRGLNVDIEVDGGIDTSNIHKIVKAGANVIVSGSTIFESTDRKSIIKKLREKA